MGIHVLQIHFEALNWNIILKRKFEILIFQTFPQTLISPIRLFVNIPALLLKNTLRFLIRAGIFTKVWIGDKMVFYKNVFLKQPLNPRVFKQTESMKLVVCPRSLAGRHWDIMTKASLCLAAAAANIFALLRSNSSLFANLF